LAELENFTLVAILLSWSTRLHLQMRGTCRRWGSPYTPRRWVNLMKTTTYYCV